MHHWLRPPGSGRRLARRGDACRGGLASSRPAIEFPYCVAKHRSLLTICYAVARLLGPTFAADKGRPCHHGHNTVSYLRCLPVNSGKLLKDLYKPQAAPDPSSK